MDYIAVPIILELLRAQVRVFVQLYRKTQRFARLNRELEQRVAQRTAVLVQEQITLEQRVEEGAAALHHERAKRQRLEGEVQRAEHFALLGRLAAGVSHEIRNPLSAVFLHVDLLEEEMRQPSPDSAEAMGQSFTEIKTQLARLDDLLQDYLSLARVATIERTSQDIGTAVQAWA